MTRPLVLSMNLSCGIASAPKLPAGDMVERRVLTFLLALHLLSSSACVAGLLLVRQPLFDVRPEFIESVGRHSAKEAFSDANHRVLSVVFAWRPPQIRKKIVAGIGGVERIVGARAAIRLVCDERELHDVQHALAEGLSLRGKVARFVP